MRRFNCNYIDILGRLSRSCLGNCLLNAFATAWIYGIDASTDDRRLWVSYQRLGVSMLKETELHVAI
jgi:hypothetical protein